jgi:hypothetical protein
MRRGSLLSKRSANCSDSSNPIISKKISFFMNMKEVEDKKETIDFPKFNPKEPAL